MLYRTMCGEKVSWLGLGTMRLPVDATSAQREKIDRDKATELIEYAYHNGINYFDSAYRYHAGESESFSGEVLAQFPRDSYYLATKFPGHMLEYQDGRFEFVGMLAGFPSPASVAEVFETQLQKCQLDYFDFYLLHNIDQRSLGLYLNKEVGVVEYCLEQKRLGRIRHLGISAHGKAETIEKFLDAYDGVIEFAQIQLNYLDWIMQGGKATYELLKSRGIDVIVMEPVRGGGLANISAEAAAIFKAAEPEASVASWALRWLQDLDGVSIVLSGMTTMEQLQENLDLFASQQPLSAAEKEVVSQVISSLVDLIGCTACRYCTEGCPAGLDIPALIALYNESGYGRSFSLTPRLLGLSASEAPSACTACGNCVKVCPQHIDVPAVMEKFAARLDKMRR